MTRRLLLIGLSVAAATLLSFEAVSAQTTTSLGQARIPRAVVADGQPLAAGTYTLRVSDAPVPGAVGQTPGESRWVEFVQGGQVRGRELATVLSGPEARGVLKGSGPASGTLRVTILRGNEYLRIWANRGGTHYLVHLALGAGAAAR